MDKVLETFKDLNLDTPEGVKALQMRTEVLHMMLDYEIRKVFQERGLVQKYDDVLKTLKPLESDDLIPFAHSN